MDLRNGLFVRRKWSTRNRSRLESGPPAPDSRRAKGLAMTSRLPDQWIESRDGPARTGHYPRTRPGKFKFPTSRPSTTPSEQGASESHDC